MQLWPVQTPVDKFEGRNIDQMPILLERGFEPISVPQLMEWRLWALDQDSDTKSGWWDQYIDCGATGAVRDSSKASGNLKINHNSTTIRGINPDSKLLNGGLILTPEQYAAVEGPEYTSEKVALSTGRWFPSARAVAEDPLWRDLAGGDKHLLKEYAQAVFAEGKERFNYDEAMRLWVPDAQKQPTERLWCVDRLGNDDRSGANGFNDLYGISVGRLVGVAPEAQPTARSAAPRGRVPGVNWSQLETALFEGLGSQPMNRGVKRTDINRLLAEYRSTIK